MKYKISTLVVTFFSIFNASFGQDVHTIKLMFQNEFFNKTLVFDDLYFKINQQDSIQINELKYYISNIELLDNGNSVWKETNSFHLIDGSNNKTNEVNLNLNRLINFNQLKFDLGIDSITNVSGAMGGDLDPTKGMYWTWKSGYINFKLEGKSNLCDSRNHEFQFHLGGYQYPHNSLQKIVVNIPQNDKIKIVLALEKLLLPINLKLQNHIMSPSKDAVLLSEKASLLFSVKE